jgi:hypothetical protein
MKKNVQDEEAPRVEKVLVGFLVEEGLGIRLKDEAWGQRKSLSELLREYCRAGLRREEIKDHRRERRRKDGSQIAS